MFESLKHPERRNCFFPVVTNHWWFEWKQHPSVCNGMAWRTARKRCWASRGRSEGLSSP